MHTIKHLVISGGANGVFAYMGAFKILQQQNFFHMDNIESIYATSAGTIVAVTMCLGYDWDTIYKFLIKRPWNTIFKINIETIIGSLSSGGIFDTNVIKDTFEPLLSGKNVSIDVTLSEFYEITKKELHFYCTDLKKYEICDVSYKTHPQWKLIDIIYASCCLPFLFSPYYIPETKDIYFDGAALLNYPITKCLANGCKKDEILGVYHMTSHDESAIGFMETKTNDRLLQYIFYMLKQLWTKTKKEYVLHNAIPYEIPIPFEISFFQLVSIFESPEERLRLLQLGEVCSVDALKKWKS